MREWGIGYTLGANVENLALTGTAAISGTGNDLDNVITGNAAANTLSGSYGNDVLDGGDGNDNLYGGYGNDRLLGGAGNDRLGTPGYDPTGDAGDDFLDGGSGDDALYDSFGNNQLFGGDGNDTLDGTGTLDGGSGNDRLNGNGTTVTLYGGDGNDALYGSGTLDGGNGDDSLTFGGNSIASGGAGRDTFVVWSSPASSGRITDFVAGVGGEVLDYNSLITQFTGYTGGNPFAGGYLRLTQSGADTLLQADKNGGGDAFQTVLTLSNVQASSLVVENFATTFTPTVVNAPLTSAASATAYEDTPYRFAVSDFPFSDADAGQTLAKLRIDSLPVQGSLKLNNVAVSVGQIISAADISAGNLAFASVANASGTNYASFNFTVSDGANWSAVSSNASSATLTLNVTPVNDVPIVANAVANQSARQASAFSYVVQANTFTDADTGDTLSYSTSQADGTALPTWLTFNATTRTFSGNPAAEDVGNLALKITATDTANASVSSPFTLVVSSNRIIGTAGADTLNGTAAIDQLDGGTGTDYLSGSTGNDTYVFGRGYGSDTISDYDSTAGNIDTVQLAAGILSSDITVSRDTNSLFLKIAGSTDQLTLANWFTNDTYKIEQVKFADGTVWDAATLAAKTAIVTGTEGNETLYGYGAAVQISGLGGNDQLYASSGNDTLDGGTGNDYLYGSAGNDTYVFARGYGNDTISEYDSTLGNVDTVQFGTGILSSDVSVSRDTSSLFLKIAGSADQLTLSNWFYNDAYKVEQVKFADGTVWDAATLLAKTNVSTDGNDYLMGTTGADRMSGGLGNDNYTVNSYDDVIIENLNEGNDNVQSSVSYTLPANVENLALTGSAAINGVGNTLNNNLTGNNAANTLDGGTGNDTLNGSNGNDIYMFGRGYGSDRISEYDSTLGNIDNIQLGAGIVTSDISLSRDANHLYLKIAGTTDQLTLANWFFNDSYKVEQVKFADGAIWDAATLLAKTNIRTDGNDYLTGTTGADTLAGGLGNDTYIINHSGDFVSENLNEGTDSVQSSVSYTLSANMENLTLTGTTATYGTGNALNNTLQGNNAANVLDGGMGNDYLYSNAGNDTYLFGRGYGSDYVSDYDRTPGNIDTVQLGADILSSDITISRDTNNLYLKIAGTTDQLTIQYQFYADTYKIEQVKFADGTVWDAATLLAKTNIGTDGNDYLTGTTGADTLAGGLGNDTYIINHSGDAVTESLNSGTDTIQANMSYTLTDNVENLTLTGTTATYGTGNALNNTLQGNSAANVLNGGAGNDYLYGNAGNDTYLFGRGYGSDTISDYDSTSGNIDTVQLGTDILTSDITLSRDNNNLYLKIAGTTDQLTIQYQFYDDSYKIEQIKFTDGTVWDAATLLAKTSISTDGNDYLVGTTDADRMTGGLGNDNYTVNSYDDVIIENLNEGNDTVQSSISYLLVANVENLTLTGAVAINGEGNALDNTITGNAAKNILFGAGGADMFIFSNFLGNTNTDTISDFLSGTDKIALSSGVFNRLFNDADLSDNLVIGGDDVKALDANDYLVYNSSTKALYYDADGSGATAAVHFATLTNVNSLNASDFVVI